MHLSNFNNNKKYIFYIVPKVGYNVLFIQNDYNISGVDSNYDISGVEWYIVIMIPMVYNDTNNYDTNGVQWYKMIVIPMV